jgi:hypothetical protein
MLSYLIEIKSAFEHKEILWFIGIIVVVLVAAFREYHDLWHPRYRYRAIICAGLFIIVISSWMVGWLSDTGCAIFLLLLMGFAFLMYRSSKKVLWPCSSLFSKIENQINAGEDVVAEKTLSRYHWLCCIDPLIRYAWNLLNAKIYSARGDIRKAYEILCDCDEQTLFEKENDLLTLKKASILAQLGNCKGAGALTSRLKNVEGDLVLQRAMVDSLCQDVRGELAASSETLLSALSTTESMASEFIPKIYNNLGRIRRIERNTTEAMLYYEKAANAAVKVGDKHLIHVSFQNLILSYALGKKFDKAEKWIEDYRAKIDETNATDLLEFDNLMLDYFRQKGDKAKLLSIIEQGRSLLYPKITEQQKLVYDISELRIRWNLQLLGPVHLAYIEQRLDKYLLLDLGERYQSFKEIHIVLERLKEMNVLYPFLHFYERVIHIRRGMESEIEDYLVSLPEYCAKEKYHWLKELASLQKIDERNYDFEQVLQRLNDLKDTLSKNENYLEAMRAGLDISDEAMFQKKNEIVWQSVQQTIKELERFKGQTGANMTSTHSAPPQQSQKRTGHI